MMFQSGCGAKNQIVKTVVKTVNVPVRVEIEKKLTEPCEIYYPEIENPVKFDIEKALRIQRIIVAECSDRFKAIRDL